MPQTNRRIWRLNSSVVCRKPVKEANFVAVLKMLTVQYIPRCPVVREVYIIAMWSPGA